MNRFHDALGRFRRRRLSADEAGELLGVSGRQFRRLCVQFQEEGEDGLRGRRLGKASSRRAEATDIGRVRSLFRDRYADFSVRRFHETLVRQHNYKLCYTVTQLALQSAGLVHKATLRGQAPPRSLSVDRCLDCCCFRAARRFAGYPTRGTNGT